MPMAETWITAAMVAAFAAIHILIRELRFIDVEPRSRWLSFSGGVAVAYVFLHVLPDLGAHQRAFVDETGLDARAAESLVYALAMVGLATLYGLERAVKVSRAQSREEGGEDVPTDDVMWLHVASYSLLNVLIGYLLLHREETGAWSLGLYFGAMALHFLTVDFGMRQDHARAYDRYGRWIITTAVVAGWIMGLLFEFPPVAIGMIFAFLSGGIVLNVLKEELPEERRSYFLPFLGGAVVYAALVLLERLWA